MSRLGQIVAEVPFEGQSFTIQRPTFSVRTITITDGDYLPLSDGLSDSQDIFDVIEDQIVAFAELSGFTIELDADGYTVATSAADTLTITWAGGEDVRDLLGFSGATTSVTTGGTTSGVLCKARWAPARPWRRDEPVDVARKSMSVSTDGTVDVISAPPHRKRRIAMRYSGGPRESAETELSVFRDLWERIVGAGRRFRFYPDKTILTEYAAISNPYGWELLIVESGGDWDPGSALTVSGCYGLSEYAVLARLVV